MNKHIDKIVLVCLVAIYVVYFSLVSIQRYQTLHAHYFDLGIMNQTVYNTYRSLVTLDWSRFLEMTNPHGMDQVKRMSVHNDMLLALLAPFYIFHAGPETLLVIQSLALGVGAFAVYGIAQHIFKTQQPKRVLPLLFVVAYLLYPPLQFTNLFDFHAVVLATPLLLFMFYFYLKRKIVPMLSMALLAVLSKEQVGLTVAFFGIYVAIVEYYRMKSKKTNMVYWAILMSIVSVGWFIVSMVIIIPHFRSSAHFAIEYFGDFGESTKDVLLGLLFNPHKLFPLIFRKDTHEYLFALGSPVGFFSYFSPAIVIALPELGINLISSNGAMRNTFFHYSAVITPFIFISAMYGFRNILLLLRTEVVVPWFVAAVFVVPVIYFSYTTSPLPYSPKKQIQSFTSPRQERTQAHLWKVKLADESIRVSASGTIAPLFSSRRYLYDFAQHSYTQADYVVLSTNDVYNGYQSERTKEHYSKLREDTSYELLIQDEMFEVYKKI